MTTPTTPDTRDTEPIWGQTSRARPTQVVPALVVVWHAGGDDRLGEVALVDDGPMVIGRGDVGEGPYPRARLFRQRPGLTQARPPLTMHPLSREQALVEPLADGRLRVERIGRCQHLANGVATNTCVLAPGDVLHLRYQVVFVVEQRPMIMSQLSHLAQDHIAHFGEVDGLGFVGEHPRAWSTRDQLAFVARTERHILLIGPSGSGKELAARALHTLSPRAHRPLIARNAATLPPGLIDAELFGNVRGYPNADMREREGLIGEAHRGTLFLDEIGELPVSLQTHLLRVLDSDGDYQRLGEARVRRSDFSLIAATNRNPDVLRHDFLARFHMRVTLDGLASRRSDIALLVRHLLRGAATSMPEIGERYFEGWGAPSSSPRIMPELIEVLMRHDFTTNIRELDTILWTAITTSPHHCLEVTPEVRSLLATRPGAESSIVTPPAESGSVHRDVGPRTVPASDTGTSMRPGPTVVRGAQELTRDTIESALRVHLGNVRKTSAMLGLPSRYVLYRLLARYGLDPNEFRAKETE